MTDYKLNRVTLVSWRGLTHPYVLPTGRSRRLSVGGVLEGAGIVPRRRDVSLGRLQASSTWFPPRHVAPISPVLTRRPCRSDGPHRRAPSTPRRRRDPRRTNLRNAAPP